MNATTRTREREIAVLNEAIQALRGTTGLDVPVVLYEPRDAAGMHPDAAIEVEVDGKRFRFLAEVKTVDRTAALAAAKHRLEPYGNRGLLVAPYLTAELADRCRRDLDLNFIDAAGNAYLRAPGLYVFVRGERPPASVAWAIGHRGRGTAIALRIVFALLGKPALLNAPYREIAGAAGVALGGVGPVLRDLEERGYLVGGRHGGNRRLLEPRRLLDEWVTTFPTGLRPKLDPRRFRPPDPAWWKRAQIGPGARCRSSSMRISWLRSIHAISR